MTFIPKKNNGENIEKKTIPSPPPPKILKPLPAFEDNDKKDKVSVKKIYGGSYTHQKNKSRRSGRKGTRSSVNVRKGGSKKSIVQELIQKKNRQSYVDRNILHKTSAKNKPKKRSYMKEYIEPIDKKEAPKFREFSFRLEKRSSKKRGGSKKKLSKKRGGSKKKSSKKRGGSKKRAPKSIRSDIRELIGK